MKSAVRFLKHYKNHILILSASLFLICCGSTETLQPSGKDLTAAQSHWNGTTMDQLTAGYNIYTTKCDDEECHRLKKPQKFTVDEWNSILPKMKRKAKLDSTEYAEVYRYILAKRETLVGGKK